MELIKDKALALLAKNQKDYSAVAKKLKVEYLLLMEIREKYRQEFEVLDTKILDDCEKVVIQCAMGNEDVSSLQVSAAKWLLERRNSKFQSKSKIKHESKTPQPNGKGREILNKFEQENGRSGNQVFSTKLQ